MSDICCYEWFQRASGEFLKNNVMVVDTSDYISLPYLEKKFSNWGLPRKKNEKN